MSRRYSVANVSIQGSWGTPVIGRQRRARSRRGSRARRQDAAESRPAPGCRPMLVRQHAQVDRGRGTRGAAPGLYSTTCRQPTDFRSSPICFPAADFAICDVRPATRDSGPCRAPTRPATILAKLVRRKTGTPRMNAIPEELCRKHGFSRASYYLWRSKFGGIDLSDALLENEVSKEALRTRKTRNQPATESRGTSGGVRLAMIGRLYPNWRQPEIGDRPLLLRASPRRAA